MECYNCGAKLGKGDICQNCGANVKIYKKIIMASNAYYNDALEKAAVRDLSGAIESLRTSLRFYKMNIDARNLLGLVYLDNVPVNGDFAEIRRHVVCGDELHFFLNQLSFFLCHIEFDLYRPFASIHGFSLLSVLIEGLGHFPTSNF